MICEKCGNDILSNARFCPNCGNQIEGINSTIASGTRTNKIQKCPNCGEMIDAYSTKCKACGYEFRNIDATSSTSELANKLNVLNKSSNDSKSRGLFSLINQFSVDKKAFDEKIDIIANFPIPNTKEDILEFMFLSSSNINVGKHKTNSELGKREKELSDAWISKMEQAYYKASITFKEDPYFERIESIYKTKKKEIKRIVHERVFFVIRNICLWVIILSLCIAPFFFWWFFSTNIDNKLDKIYQEILIDINDSKYDEALIKANELRYDRSISTTKAEEWDQKRDAIITIINEKKGK